MNVKILVAGAVLLSMSASSCVENSSAYKKLQAKCDSLDSVNSILIADKNSAESLISEIINNFNTINESTSNIDYSKLGPEMRKDEKDRVRDNLRLINEKLNENRQKIDLLEQQLQTSGSKNAKLALTVARLREQLESKEKEIRGLYAKIEQQSKHIGVLDSTLQDANKNLSEQKSVNERQARINETQAKMIAEQDAALNLVYYCIGTASDLKDMGLLKSGRLQINDDKNYFTSADRRECKRIPLHTTKAILLTNHNPNSYELVRGSDKQLTLLIKDANEFWKNSKALVVQVK